MQNLFQATIAGDRPRKCIWPFNSQWLNRGCEYVLISSNFHSRHSFLVSMGPTPWCFENQPAPQIHGTLATRDPLTAQVALPGRGWIRKMRLLASGCSTSGVSTATRDWSSRLSPSGDRCGKLRPCEAHQRATRLLDDVLASYCWVANDHHDHDHQWQHVATIPIPMRMRLLVV